MSVAKQLYQLQEIDLELESHEQAVKQITSQLGESESVITAQNKVAMEQQGFEELVRQQHSIEWEIDDVITKLKTVEDELYSGRIRNPKELTNLQHETDGLKSKRNRLEDRALEIMDQVELTTKSIATMNDKLKALETEWQRQQEEMSASLKQHENMLVNLKQKRQSMSAEIDPQAITIYDLLRKQKGTAVAKVEQGICRGCRISLPVNELQRTKSGGLVQCSSCGRIMFLA